MHTFVCWCQNKIITRILHHRTASSPTMSLPDFTPEQPIPHPGNRGPVSLHIPASHCCREVFPFFSTTQLSFSLTIPSDKNRSMPLLWHGPKAFTLNPIQKNQKNLTPVTAKMPLLGFFLFFHSETLGRFVGSSFHRPIDAENLPYPSVVFFSPAHPLCQMLFPSLVLLNHFLFTSHPFVCHYPFVF